MTTDDTRPLAAELGLTDDAEHPDRTRPEGDRPDGTATPRRDAATAGPATPGSTTQGPAAHGSTTPDPTTGAPPVVYRKGPAPFAVFLGLVGLLVAGGVFVEQVAEVSVPWDDLGPWAVVAGGLVVLLVGVLGLRATRDDS